AFAKTYRALRAKRDASFSPLQDAAGAECLVIAAPSLAWCEGPDAADALHSLRTEALARFTPNRPEDALDAAILLAAESREARDGRLAIAWQLAQTMRASGATITLPLALLATAGESSLEPAREAAIR